MTPRVNTSLAHEYKLTYITYIYPNLLTFWCPGCPQWHKWPTESPSVAPLVCMMASPTMLLCMCQTNVASKKSDRQEWDGKCHVMPSGNVVYLRLLWLSQTAWYRERINQRTCSLGKVPQYAKKSNESLQVLSFNGERPQTESQTAWSTRSPCWPALLICIFR